MTGCNIALRYDPNTGKKMLDASGWFGTQTTEFPMDCEIETLIEALTCAAAKLQVVKELEKDHGKAD